MSAGAGHFIENGYNEGRTTTFDGLDYIANYTDLMKAFGANNDAGATHYINNGFSERRQHQLQRRGIQHRASRSDREIQLQRRLPNGLYQYLQSDRDILDVRAPATRWTFFCVWRERLTAWSSGPCRPKAPSRFTWSISSTLIVCLVSAGGHVRRPRRLRCRRLRGSFGSAVRRSRSLDPRSLHWVRAVRSKILRI